MELTPAAQKFVLHWGEMGQAWGINRTADFGEIVFNLIAAGLMSKTDRDDRRDFHDVYDLDEALRLDRLALPQEAEEAARG